MFQNLLPFRWIIVSSKIGLEFSRKDFEGGGFSNTVRSDQTEDLTWTRGWESMQFEGVGIVSVGNVGFEIGGQVENLDGFEWAPSRVSWFLQKLDDVTYFLTQIPHPIHSSSDKNAFLSVGFTSIQSFPILTTGHERLHS